MMNNVKRAVTTNDMEKSNHSSYEPSSVTSIILLYLVTPDNLD